MDTASPFIVPTLASSSCWVMTSAKGDGPLPTPAIEPTTATTCCYLCPPKIQRFSESSSAKVPALPKKDEEGNRPDTRKAVGRLPAPGFAPKKSVALTKEEYLRLVAQPCVYCATRGKIGADRVRNIESYTRENAAPCCRRCNRGI